ncbi:hypothetical protein RND81_08G051100 [Saponaria officinalis]|uniref:CCHC-type domain-containing protein n=1 Tax=Saponaria officinalis TaxID=3572 RepID=A0AAW1J3R1_SAPOF
MVRPGGKQERREAADVARMRRLEDAFIAFANNANQAGGQQQQLQAIFDKFARRRPPTYDGLCDPVVLEAWIREMEKLFTATLCPEDQKVGIATYYLQREADNWWSISRAAIQAQPGFGWAHFCEALKRRFYPDELRWQKERDFLRLEQGKFSVQTYADKFMELSRFATTIVLEETSRVRRFEKNLTPKVRTVLAGSPSVTFQQAYDRALSVYESVKAEEAETERRNPSLSEILNVKRPFSPQSSYQETKKARFEPKPSDNRTSGTPAMICYKCRKPYHPGKSCDGSPMLCFICKKPRHKAKDCPKKFPGAVRGPRSGSGSQTRKGRISVMTRVGAKSHPDSMSGIFLL